VEMDVNAITCDSWKVHGRFCNLFKCHVKLRPC